MASTIDITGYDNEDIVRAFTMKTGTIDSSTAINISTWEFEMDIVDQRTGLSVLHLASTGGSPKIVKTDATNGKFSVTVSHAALTYDPKAQYVYDILRLISGVPTRLWGGKFKLLDGATTP